MWIRKEKGLVLLLLLIVASQATFGIDEDDPGFLSGVPHLC
jgi:hypothetical protein